MGTFDFLGEKNLESEVKKQYMHDNIVNQTDDEHGESDDVEATSDQDDSGYYCDSDSGISSLYETIRRHGQQQTRPSEIKNDISFETVSVYETIRRHSEHPKSDARGHMLMYKPKPKSLYSDNCTEHILYMLNIGIQFYHIFEKNPAVSSKFYFIKKDYQSEKIPFEKYTRI